MSLEMMSVEIACPQGGTRPPVPEFSLEKAAPPAILCVNRSLLMTSAASSCGYTSECRVVDVRNIIIYGFQPIVRVIFLLIGLLSPSAVVPFPHSASFYLPHLRL